jgi:sec-independent protein translocase protein TatB
MFDIAWTELLVIIVVALVVVGPKDLPKMMRTVGQWAGRARAMADQFRRSFDDIARQSELDELRQEVNRLQHTQIAPSPAEIESAMYPTGNPLNLNSPVEDVSLPSPPQAEAPAPAVASAEPATTAGRS